jgi:hypothetical protein
MEDSSKQRLLFKDLGGKKIEADFEGGEVTSDAGVLFFRELDRRIRLTARVAVMDCCEGNDVHYIPGVTPNPRLSEQARP